AGSTASITMTRSSAGTGPVSVDFTSSNLTSLARSGYFATNGTLILARGQTNLSFAVPIINDTRGEGDETILLTLSNPGGEAVLGLTNQAILTIIDNDVSFEFSQTNYGVRENGGNAVITVVRVGNTNGAFSIAFTTSDG